jgi:perosamine synthetase
MSDTGLNPTHFEPGAAPPDFIPLCVPELRGNEWKYIKECLDTNWVSSAGPFVDRFERMLAAYVGADAAVATVNGTAALHVALLVAGIQPDDEVLLPILTFIAPANAVRYVGAWPVFIDVEPHYWQLDPGRTIEFLDRQCRCQDGELFNRSTGRRVRAVMPVHILGHPVDMDPIVEVAQKYGLAVIEDATESLGASYKRARVGSLGDIACFSFNGNKIITSGGGGMIVTNRREWAEKAKYLTTQAKDDTVEYVHCEIGYNYRLSNLQAAVGCAQMEQLEEFVDSKRSLASSYDEALDALDGITPMREASWARSIFWMYTVLVEEQQFGMGSRALLRRLVQSKIQARPLWQPLHRSPAHRGAQSCGGEVAERIHSQALSLPSSSGLSEAELAIVTSALQTAATGKKA